jgi:hypothetical protein
MEKIIEQPILVCENPIIIRYSGHEFELNLGTEMKHVAPKSRRYYTVEDICNKIKSNDFKIDIKFSSEKTNYDAIENATIILNMDPTVKKPNPLKLNEVFRIKDIDIPNINRYVKLENKITKLSKEELLELVHLQNNYIQFLKYEKEKLEDEKEYLESDLMHYRRNSFDTEH